MGSVNESIKTFNSTVRTLIGAVVVGGAGYTGYHAYEVYNEPKLKLKQKQEQLDQALSDLTDAQKQVEQIAAEVERLEASLYLLKIDHRVAELRVIDQKPGEREGSPVISTVEFVETDPEGKPIGQPRRFDVPGDQVYLEYLVVKFDDKYVEEADLERGTAICLFQRLFGSEQKPEEGFTLDEPNTRPTAYARGEKINEFEQKIWRDFWDLAHDPKRLEAMGIRSAMADAPSVKARPGTAYRLQIRATGGFQLRTIAD